MFIAVEKTSPTQCALNGYVITCGRKLYEADLQTYRNCVDNDEWTGYEDSYFAFRNGK
jgi:hypothetical protein